EQCERRHQVTCGRARDPWAELQDDVRAVGHRRRWALEVTANMWRNCLGHGPCVETDACREQIGHRALPSQCRQESYHALNDAHGNAPVLRTNSRHIACSHAGPLAKGAPMTFGKCVWDGCTRHAEKPATNACRSHHVTI